MNPRFNFINEKGKRYGKLVVIGRSITKAHLGYWVCKCDCGNYKEIKGSHLRRNSIVSCGCQRGKTQPRGYSSLKSRFYNYRTKAHQRNLSFELDEYQFLHLTQELCYWCGAPPSNIHTGLNGNYIFNGIDRIDNNLGYTLDNCVACCAKCNMMKRGMTQEEWIAQMKRILQKQGVRI